MTNRFRLWSLLPMLVACGGSSTAEPGADGAADAEPIPDATSDTRSQAPPDAVAETGGDGDAGVTAADARGFCCPASPTPSCCMDFGGWTDGGEPCAQVCDGFQLPTQLGKDSHGCNTWTGAAGPVCGSALDASSDADAGAQDAATANPPGCPTTFGSDGGACPTMSSCRYAQGVCDCESSHCGGVLLPDAEVRMLWTCVALDPNCPPSPATGGTCSGGLKCSYGSCCAPTIQCGSGGTWQSGVGNCPP